MSEFQQSACPSEKKKTDELPTAAEWIALLKRHELGLKGCLPSGMPVYLEVQRL